MLPSTALATLPTPDWYGWSPCSRPSCFSRLRNSRMWPAMVLESSSGSRKPPLRSGRQVSTIPTILPGSTCT